MGSKRGGINRLCDFLLVPAVYRSLYLSGSVRQRTETDLPDPQN
jgi:hypothetical protein